MAKCELNCKCKRHVGCKHSFEVRAKLATLSAGRRPSPETRAKMSAAKKGNQSALGHKYTPTPETRIKISSALMGRTPTPETRAKLSAAAAGRRPTPETRVKLSAAKKGNQNARGHTYKHTLKTRMKVGATLRGRKYTAEHRANISAGARKHSERILPECRCVAHHLSSPRSVSRLSAVMVSSFLYEFPEVTVEKQFGRCRVDAYLPPPYHLAFEADGDYWHQIQEERRPGYYQRRDAYLKSHFGLITIRLTETEINEAASV